MGRLTLVLGGVRSGKSAYGEELAAAAGTRVLYLATAEPSDSEMRDRIQAHRARRPAGWRTLEAPLDPAGLLISTPGDWDAVLLDSVSAWIGNLLVGSLPAERQEPKTRRERLDAEVGAKIDHLLDWSSRSATHLIAVSDEVGLGLVSPNRPARLFQDLLGTANQILAAAADHVVLVAAGLPLQLKGNSTAPHGISPDPADDPDRR